MLDHFLLLDHVCELGEWATAPLFLDDFGDGDVKDGVPGTWSGTTQVLDASSGDLIISAASSQSARLTEMSAIKDVSIQTQLCFSQISGNRDGVILFARSGAGSYWGELTTDGLLAFGAVQPNGGTTVWSIQQTQIDPVGGDVRLRFDVVGDRVSLSAWPAGSTNPPAPQLSRQSDQIPNSGQLGVTLLPNIRGGNGIASAQLRYIFIHDGQANDADLLALAIRHNSTDAAFDLDKDGNVSQTDRIHWVHEIQQTYFGDANLDGEFNTGDFVQVLGSGKYESLEYAGWGQGDWNGDGVFDTGDLVKALEDGGYEMGPREPVAVPEPKTLTLLLTAACLLFMRMRTAGPLILLLLPLILAPFGTAHADIYRWDNGQLIPGTKGIEPGPGVDLSSRSRWELGGEGPWSTEDQNLRYADFSGVDLTQSIFRRSWLDNADFSGADLADTDFVGVRWSNESS